MRKTKIAVAFLAYRDDSELVLESERAAIAAFAKSERFEPYFVLVDDAWCGVRREAREKFLKAHPNAMYLATGYRRGKMILGGECILGECEAFEEIAGMTGAEIVVKMDADTCMFKVDWLEEFAERAEADCAGAFDFGNGNHTSVFGLCYALKARVLHLLVDDLRRYPAHHKAWEDHEVSSRVFRLAGGEMDSLLRWRSNTHGDDFWVVPLRQANETFVNARAANCGWDYSTTPASDRAAYRAKVLEWMRKWNDLTEKAKAKEAGDDDNDDGGDAGE